MPPEEQQFGIEGVEASQGLSQMPESSPVEDDRAGRELTPREGASELTDRRQEPGRGEEPPDIVSYRDEKGKRTDRRQSVKLDRAARDLTSYRESKVQEAERQERDLVRQHADALRSGQQSPLDAQRQPADAKAQPAVPSEARTPYQQWHHDVQVYEQALARGAQDPAIRRDVRFTQTAIAERMQNLGVQIAEAWAQGHDVKALNAEFEHTSAAYENICFVDRAQLMMAQGLSPKVAAAISDRDTLQWMQQATEGYEEAYRTVVEKHEQNCMALINSLQSVLLWMFPELQLSDDIKKVVASVRQAGQHRRADDIQRWYGEFERAVGVGQQAKQRNDKEKRERFQVWARNEDNIFRGNNPEFIAPLHQKQVAEEAFAYLESLGVGREEVIKLHDTDTMFRGHVGQQVLLDALKHWRLQKARETLPSKRYREPTQTIKPGSSETYLEPRGEQLPASFSGKQSGLRAAAAVLSNRRTRR